MTENGYEAVKVGDEIVILINGANCANVKKGDVLTVVEVKENKTGEYENTSKFRIYAQDNTKDVPIDWMFFSD